MHQPLTQNRHLYTTGNPVNYADPSGHSPLSSVLGNITGTVKTVTGTTGSVSNAAKGTTATAPKLISAPKMDKTKQTPAVPQPQAVYHTAASTAGLSGGQAASSEYTVMQNVGQGTTVLGTTLDMYVRTLTSINRVFCSADALRASSEGMQIGNRTEAIKEFAKDPAIWELFKAIAAGLGALLTSTAAFYVSVAVLVVLALYHFIEFIGDHLVVGSAQEARDLYAEAVAVSPSVVKTKTREQEKYVVLFHYGYLEDAMSYAAGMLARTYYTVTDTYTGSQAVMLLALPTAKKDFRDPDGVLSVEIPLKYYNALAAQGQIEGPEIVPPETWPGQGFTPGGGIQIRIMVLLQKLTVDKSGYQIV